MRRLTEEEAHNIPSKPAGKISKAKAVLLGMNVGEIVLLERSEWKQKHNSPTELIRRMRISHKRNYDCNTALDGSGWIIKRLK